MFDTATYQNRRKGLFERLDSGIVVLLGNEESPMNYQDNAYPFRQDSSFLYYIGLDRPHLAAVLDVDAGTTTLYGEEITIDHIVWMGSQPTLADRAARSGIDRTAPFEQLEKDLDTAHREKRDIHFLPPYRHDAVINLHKWLQCPLEELSARASLPLIKAVIDQRSVKSKEEIKEMEEAVSISGAMHLAVMKATRPGIREAQLAGIAEGIAVGAGGRLSYPAIVTVNGQILHNHSHSNRLKKGQLLLGDFGAETGRHYAGDITRTLPVDRTFTGRQKEIYEIVLDAQVASLESLRPGIRFLESHLLAARRITKGLQAIGLMKGDAAEAVEAGAHALFFPHGLGHMIGLDVHDMEGLGEDLVGYSEQVSRSNQFGLRSLRLGKNLKPGYTLTVEPGLYFIPELIQQWKKEKKLDAFINYSKLEDFLDFGGIRIEDNVVVTETGYRILGNPIPKTIEAIESIRKG